MLNLPIIIFFVTTGGGALYLENSKVYFRESYFAHFESNRAVHCSLPLIQILKSLGTPMWNLYADELGGGAIFCNHYTSLLFDENSTIKFNDNRAQIGGAIYIYDRGDVRFDGNSSAAFTGNTAFIGGSLYVKAHSTDGC